MNDRQLKAINTLRYNPARIGHLLGFVDFKELHNKWMVDFINKKTDYTLQSHRGSYKTTCLEVSIAILMILLPNKDIKLFRKTDDAVKEVVNTVRKLLESEVLQYFAQIIYGQGFEVTGNMNEISTSLRTTNKGSNQLVAIGIRGGNITGKHGDIVITDDIVTVKDRISPAERKMTNQQYQELQNVKNRNGRFINTGTPWHKEDAFTLMGEIERYDCYSTGLISKEQLQKLRESMSASLFSANYELKHIADEDALFKTEPKFFNDKKLLEQGIAHIDAGYGGEDGSAFTLGRRIGDKYYLYGKLKQRHIDDCLDGFISLTKDCKCGTIWVEKNADKGYLQKEIIRKGYLSNSYNEGENKYVKISTFLKMNWNNVYFYEDTDPEYISQIMDYNENAKHDDAPDSASCMIRKLKQTLIIA